MYLDQRGFQCLDFTEIIFCRGATIKFRKAVLMSWTSAQLCPFEANFHVMEAIENQ